MLSPYNGHLLPGPTCSFQKRKERHYEIPLQRTVVFVQDEDLAKCFICEAPTNNGQHLGQILCDTCVAEVEMSVMQMEPPEMPEHFYDLEV